MICSDCGKKHGKPQFYVTTFNHGTCDWCGKETSVTPERHYGLKKEDRPHNLKGKGDISGKERR